MTTFFRYSFSASFHDLQVRLQTERGNTFTSLFLVRFDDEPVYLGGMALPEYDVKNPELVAKNVQRVISVVMDSMKFATSASIK